MSSHGFVIENGVLVSYTGNDSHVVVPDGVARIGENAFMGNETLTSITMPESVDFICSGAFKNCCRLTDISFPKTLMDVACDAFDNTPWLEAGDMVISNTGMLLKYQGASDTVTIPESVTDISWHAFDKCTSIKSIEFPASIEEISAFVFSDCANLANLHVSAHNPRYRSEGNCILEGQTLILGGSSTMIPKGVTTIGTSAFRGRRALKKVVIPEGVTQIDTNAFEGCSGLVHVELPGTLISIGRSAFDKDLKHSCSRLEYISIPDSVTHIGENAFRNCYALKSMYLSKQITNIRITGYEYGGGEIVHCNYMESSSRIA